MDALLILGGLLLILTGLVWLVMLAFGTSLLWGLGSLLPPLTLAYVLRHWRTARKAVVLAGLGCIPLVVGLTLLASHDSQRLAAILSLNWLKPEVQAPAELAIQLRGELNGQPFAPQQGELIDGTLSLREGQDFFARREISIRLPQPVKGAVQVDVLPQDRGQLPDVQVSWLLPEQELPEARRLSHGYTLHLNLKPQAPNKLVGDFHLVLPPQFKTTLSGRVELFSDRLRYVDGKVDTHYDSRDTLSYVIEDYLQRRFATRAVQLVSLPPVNLPADSLDLQVEARIDGQPQRLPLLLQKSTARGWRVKGDQYPLLAPVTSEQATSKSMPEAINPTASRPLDRRLRFSLERLQSNPSRYQNLSMRVQTARGAQAEGRFKGIDTQGQIVIQRNLSGAGEASFTLRPDEISQIELLEP
ncbi:MFS transporter [Pseudomonas cavernae]|uniref:MFS transporter n=1 Tax=Pseudomonas cavernae TaxID=2320867 RepID=A0A385Z245_9PSED|nr:MFS transporter [Pseudomonas cavernae]AYC33325.1 MFS transporter [Pseudomonas cavernae]